MNLHCNATGAFARAMIMLLFALVSGCTNEQSHDSSDADHDQHELRIVSISPALTRMVVDLGLGERIVGRTPWCTAVDQAVPVVGDLNDINYEMLTRLKPTHVLIQPAQGAVPDSLSNLSGERDWNLTSTHIDSVRDIRTALEAVAEAISIDGDELSGQVARRLVRLRSQLEELVTPSEPPEKIWRGDVLLLYQVDPPSVFGVGTYLDDVLTHLGATNATEARGWAQLTLEDVTRLDPAAILFIQPGTPEDVYVMDAIGPFAELDIAGVREQRIGVIRHPDALLPSTSVIDVAAEMRAALERWN